MTKHATLATETLTAWSVGALLRGTGIRRSARSPPITCHIDRSIINTDTYIDTLVNKGVR